MNLEFIPRSENNREDWNNFCLQSHTAWFRHTTWFLDYILSCRFDNKSKDLSFEVQLNGKLVAIVPVIFQSLYPTRDKFEFALYDTNLPFAAFINNYKDFSPDTRKDVTKEICIEIERLAKANSVSYIRIFNDELTEETLSGQHNVNIYPKYGYLDTTISANIIEFKKNTQEFKSEQELLSNVRHGHKADIKFAQKNKMTIEIFNKDNISLEIFSKYKKMHIIAAGRQTRPDNSWEKMYDWIKNGYSFLAFEKVPDHEEYISGALIITYQNKAYYGSAATLPEFEGGRAIGHILQWEIIKYLLNAGYSYYDIGWNFYPAISQELGHEKEFRISLFKAGFGSVLYPVFRAEKFLSKEFLIERYHERLDHYVTHFL